MTAAVTTVVSGQHFLEAPRWRDGRIWFSDFYGHQVQSALEDGSDLRTEATVPEQPAGLGWLPDGRLLVVSMRRPQGAAPRSRRHPGDPCGPGFGRHRPRQRHGRRRRGPRVRGQLRLRPDERLPAGDRLAAPGNPDGTVTEVATDLWSPMTVITPDNVLIVNETFGNRCTAFDLTVDGQLVNRRVWPSSPRCPPTAPWTSCSPSSRWRRMALPRSEGAPLDGRRRQRPPAPRHQGGTITDEIEPGSPVYACALGGADAAPCSPAPRRTSSRSPARPPRSYPPSHPSHRPGVIFLTKLPRGRHPHLPLPTPRPAPYLSMAPSTRLWPAL